MLYLFGILIFLLGACLGSFITVIANRYNTGLSFWKGRSFCFTCNTELKTKDLFPLFSFLFLKGRCRYCESKIPKETFVIEILMGVLSVVAAFKSGLVSLELGAMTVEIVLGYFLITAIFAVILLISVYDLKHFIIPDSFLITFLISSFLYLFVSHSDFFSLSIFQSSMFHSFLSGIALTIPFLFLFLISKGTWLGFGDVKYIVVLGFFLGFVQGLSAVILAFWIGAAFSILALLFQKLNAHIRLPLLKNHLTIKSEIPFGPFLSLGIILSFYFNADIFQIHSLLSL